MREIKITNPTGAQGVRWFSGVIKDETDATVWALAHESGRHGHVEFVRDVAPGYKLVAGLWNFQQDEPVVRDIQITQINEPFSRPTALHKNVEQALGDGKLEIYVWLNGEKRFWHTKYQVAKMEGPSTVWYKYGSIDFDKGTVDGHVFLRAWPGDPAIECNIFLSADSKTGDPVEITTYGVECGVEIRTNHEILTDAYVGANELHWLTPIDPKHSARIVAPGQGFLAFSGYILCPEPLMTDRDLEVRRVGGKCRLLDSNAAMGLYETPSWEGGFTGDLPWRDRMWRKGQKTDAPYFGPGYDPAQPGDQRQLGRDEMWAITARNSEDIVESALYDAMNEWSIRPIFKKDIDTGEPYSWVVASGVRSYEAFPDGRYRQNELSVNKSNTYNRRQIQDPEHARSYLARMYLYTGDVTLRFMLDSWVNYWLTYIRRYVPWMGHGREIGRSGEEYIMLFLATGDPNLIDLHKDVWSNSIIPGALDKYRPGAQHADAYLKPVHTMNYSMDGRPTQVIGPWHEAMVATAVLATYLYMEEAFSEDMLQIGLNSGQSVVRTFAKNENGEWGSPYILKYAYEKTPVETPANLARVSWGWWSIAGVQAFISLLEIRGSKTGYEDDLAKATKILKEWPKPTSGHEARWMIKEEK